MKKTLAKSIAINSLKDIKIFALVRSMMIVLSALTLLFLYYFGYELVLQSRFNTTLQNIDKLASLAYNLHQERAMQALLRANESVDHQNIEILRASSDEALMDLNIKDENLNLALARLRHIRDDMDQNRSDFNAELFSRYKDIDKEIFNAASKIKQYATNVQQIGPAIALISLFYDTITLNEIRDFLIPYIVENKPFDDETKNAFVHIHKHDTLYEELIANGSMKNNDLFDVYRGNNAALKEQIKELKKDKNYKQAQEFLEKLYAGLLQGKKPEVSFYDFYQNVNMIENKNIELAYMISSDLQESIKKSRINLFVYIFIALLVAAYGLFAFYSLHSNKKRLEAVLKLINEHKNRLSAIASKRKQAPDSEKIFALFEKTAKQIESGDIIERKHQEERKTFLANISHEIKEPLNVIIGYNEILRNERPNSNGKEFMHYLDIMDESSSKLLKLLNNLVVISKLQSGSVEVKNSGLSILEAPFRAFEPFNRKLKKKNIELFIYVDPSLEGILDIDIEKLDFILTSLIDNAIEYNNKGGKILMQIVRLNETENNKINVKFSVVDTGSGLKEHIIFEDFTNEGDTRLQIYNGGGLDLRLCNQYLRMLGSKFEMKSKRDVGTKISFVIDAKFKRDPRLMDKFKGEQIVVYSKNIPYESSFTRFDGDKLPSFFDAISTYLSYLGFSYTVSDSYDKDAVYIVRGTKKPFDDAKTILISNKQPEFTDDFTIWVREPIEFSALVDAYEKITGKKENATQARRINLSTLVIAEPMISSILGELVSQIHTQINPMLHYDMAFIDTDLIEGLNLDSVQQPCSFIAISSSIEPPINNKVVFDDYITKADDNTEHSKRLMKDKISHVLARRKQNAMLSNNKLRDILIFKKSAAANNIYASAFRSFSDKVDTVRNMVSLGEALNTRPYKIVICDADITELNIHTYLEIITAARKKHGYDIIAGLFVNNNFKIESSLAREFELFYSSLNRPQLELKLRPILEGKR